MKSPIYSMVRFLSSKQSVDDRALNRSVIDALRNELTTQNAAPRVLELGAGLGNMVARLSDWGVLRHAEYTLLDRDTESLAEAARSLRAFAERSGTVSEASGGFSVQRAAGKLELRFQRAELFEALQSTTAPGRYDLIIANAVLDLVDVPTLLPLLWRALVPGGLLWLTINFDGETILLPELPLDRRVMELYHRTMDTRVIDGRRAGDSKTGRALLQHLPASGGTILSAGSSDWVVWPRDGRYPDDEQYFLHHIVYFIENAVREGIAPDEAAFAEWIETRRSQIAAGKLSYIAHQIDVLARAPRAAATV